MKHDPEFIRAVVASYGKQPKSVVAKRHGITPNTVSGIWHRHVPADVKAALQANLRRHRRASVKKAIAAHPVKWNSTRHGGAEMKADAPELAVAVVVAADAPAKPAGVPHTAGLPITHIERHQCHYPVGRSDRHLFCGAPIDPTCRSPFCAGHRALAYTGTVKTKPDLPLRLSAFQLRRAV